MREISLSRLVIAATFLVLGASACFLPLEPDGVVRTLKPASIVFHTDSAEVIAPSTVFVGEPFEVTVSTFGGGCTSFGETRLSVSGLTAEIRPYDSEVTHAPKNYGCTGELLILSHTVTLDFNRRGRALIWIYGRSQPDGELVAFAREVDVR